MKEKLTIVKIGGSIVGNDTRLNEFLSIFGKLEGRKLLVHGGGKTATQLASSLGIETKMVEGRRITDDQMIDVVVMTYAGLINKKLVASLSARGIKSIGLTGADGNSIKAHKRTTKNGLNFGWVGDIETVNSNFLSGLIAQNLIPVMAPITHDEAGHLLNTNADTVASEIAIALAQQFEVSLNFIFEHKGVMRDINDPESLLRSIDKSSYEVLKKEKAITDGMIPKIENAFRTIGEGVSKVRLLDALALSHLQNPDFNEYTTIH